MTYTIRQDHGVSYTVDRVDDVGDYFPLMQDIEKSIKEYIKDKKERPWILPKWSARFAIALCDVKEKERIG